MRSHPQGDLPQNVGARSCYLSSMDYAVLGKRLKKLRKSARLTMKELGARLGYSYQWVDNVEGGRRDISIDDVERFAEACGQRLVFELAPPDALPVILSAEDRVVVDMARDLPVETKAGLLVLTAPKAAAIREFIELVQGAGDRGIAVALSVLRGLQEGASATAARPAPYLTAVGDPDES